MYHTIEGQKMVLTHGIKGDILEDYKFAVPQLVTDYQLFLRVLTQTHKELFIHLGDAPRRSSQAITPGVFPDSLYN